MRAALEAMAYQVLDVVDAMPERPEVLRIDGGASSNGFLVQFLADVLGVPVEVAAEQETTALGAAALAGVTVGLWSQADLAGFRRTSVRCEPTTDRSEPVAGWRDALRRALL